MTKICFICGTRPEVIKCAPVYRLLRDEPWAQVTWVHTGQHQALSDEAYHLFEIEPNVRLSRDGTSLAHFSAGLRRQLDEILQTRKSDLVVVQGDTESAFVGALAAFYCGIPIAHIEAGLRSGDLRHPFPEEGLRQMISRIARLHFAPSMTAEAALVAEGISPKNVHVTGNTVIDAQRWIVDRHQIRPQRVDKQVLVTLHRREIWGSELEEVCRAIASIARRNEALQFVFPVHPNPVIKDRVHAALSGLINVDLRDSVDYVEMQQILADTWLVLTDSGGIQEEAPTFGAPVLVLRRVTERPEAVNAGYARVIGTDYSAIVAAVEELLFDDQRYASMKAPTNPFGDGRASSRIVQHMRAYCLSGQGLPS